LPHSKATVNGGRHARVFTSGGTLKPGFLRTATFLTLYNARVEDNRRSLMLSALSVAMFLGFSIGNLLLGVVSAQTSISWAWTLVAVGLLFSLGLFRHLRVSASSEPV